jgi:hypothetical protein
MLVLSRRNLTGINWVAATEETALPFTGIDWRLGVDGLAGLGKELIELVLPKFDILVVDRAGWCCCGSTVCYWGCHFDGFVLENLDLRKRIGRNHKSKPTSDIKRNDWEKRGYRGMVNK